LRASLATEKLNAIDLVSINKLSNISEVTCYGGNIFLVSVVFKMQLASFPQFLYKEGCVEYYVFCT